MENWKEEIIEHVKERQDFIEEVNQSAKRVVNELRGSFPQSLEVIKMKTKVEFNGNKANPKWEVSIGDFLIEFGLRDVRSHGSKQDELGNWIFDESADVNESIKKLIKTRIKNM